MSQAVDQTENEVQNDQIDGAEDAKSQEEKESELKRQDAPMFDDVDEELNVFTCKKCKVETDMKFAVARGPFEVWCKECNSLYTMLRRHLAWRPQDFVDLLDDQQSAFWARCKQEKLEAKAGKFSYQSVRNCLVTSLKEETIRQKKTAVGGTYLPLSVYRQKGYHIDSGFSERNHAIWSSGLNE